ncbi:MAG: Na+/H+ antiporter NhaA, partial [Bauldia litoralis]
MPLASIRSFVRHEAFGGILLMAAAVLALVLVNSPLAPLYDSLLKTQMTVAVGAFSIDKPVLLWINDGLMADFYILIGLEIKREFVEGELSSPSKA